LPTRRGMTSMIILILTLIAVVLLASCANPHRFDPLRQQQLEHQQEECLAKGGNPRECRP